MAKEIIYLTAEGYKKLKDELAEKWEITRDEWNQKLAEWDKKKEELKQDVMKYVNSKVNRFSKITKVIDNEGEFEKTPTKKIRRFVYDRSKTPTNEADKK